MRKTNSLSYSRQTRERARHEPMRRHLSAPAHAPPTAPHPHATPHRRLLLALRARRGSGRGGEHARSQPRKACRVSESEAEEGIRKRKAAAARRDVEAVRSDGGVECPDPPPLCAAPRHQPRLPLRRRHGAHQGALGYVPAAAVAADSLRQLSHIDASPQPPLPGGVCH